MLEPFLDVFILKCQLWIHVLSLCVQQSVDMWYLRVVQDQKCLWRKTRHTACICPSYVDTVKQFVACLGRLPLQTLTLRTLISLLLAVEPSYSGANRHLLANNFFSAS